MSLWLNNDISGDIILHKARPGYTCMQSEKEVEMW